MNLPSGIFSALYTSNENLSSNWSFQESILSGKTRPVTLPNSGSLRSFLTVGVEGVPPKRVIGALPSLSLLSPSKAAFFSFSSKRSSLDASDEASAAAKSSSSEEASAAAIVSSPEEASDAASSDTPVAEFSVSEASASVTLTVSLAASVEASDKLSVVSDVTSVESSVPAASDKTAAASVTVSS